MDHLLSTLIRTTACVLISACLVKLLLARSKRVSPYVVRVACVMALFQGWLFVTLPLPITLPPGYLAPIESKQTGVEPSALAVTISDTRDVPTQLNVLPSPPQRTGHFTLIVFACWSAGMAALLVRSALRYSRLAVMLPLGQPPTESAWKQQWDNVRMSTNCRQAARLRVTDSIGPLVCYIPFAYLVLVPCSIWRRLSSDQRETILRHELAHVRRGDLWKSSIVRLLLLPQWFNPIAWWIVRVFDEAAEWACDDIVIQSSDKNESVYASALLKIAELSQPTIPASVAAGGGELSRRIRRFIGASSHLKTESTMRKSLVIIALASLALAQSVRVQAVADHDHEVAIRPTPIITPNELSTLSAERKSQLAAAGLLPYRVGSPDILLVRAAPKTPQGSDETSVQIWGERLVGPEGLINLGSHGSVPVNGLTVHEIRDAIEERLADDSSDVQVTVDVVSQGSKCWYLVLRSDGQPDQVSRVPCSITSQLRDVAKWAGALPNEVNLQHTKIELKRGKEPSRQIAYEEIMASPQPITSQTSILPGDQIVVVASATQTEQRQPTSSAGEVAADPNTDSRPTIKMHVEMIRDADGNMQEFGPLKDGWLICTESEPMLAMLRILKKHELIQTLASPSVSCGDGQQASIAISTETARGQDEPFKGMQLGLRPKVADDATIVLEVNYRDANAKVDSMRVLSSLKLGQTMVVRTHPTPHEKVDSNGAATYIAIRPEIIRVAQ